MDERIIFEKNGKVSILSPSLNYRTNRDDLNDAEFFQHLINKDVPESMRASAQVVNLSSIPVDRTFRNAWRKNGVTIQVNLPEAREIHRDKIAGISDREMKALVDEIVIGQALGNDVTALQAQIQGIQTAVDNVGPNINAAGTPAMLKAVWPVGLPTE